MSATDGGGDRFSIAKARRGSLTCGLEQDGAALTLIGIDPEEIFG
jgi:hypothetical protein